jgi:hypothetical protein
MKTTWIIKASGAVLGLALGITTIASLRSAAELRRANQILHKDLHTARAHAESLANEKQEAARQLALVVNRHSELTSRIAMLEASEIEETAMATSPAAMKPYQAEAYLGRKPLGLVWIVPRNLRMDTNSQRFVYEPVVCLDERLRSQFVVNYTNIVEREIERPVYVNNSYYEEPYYYPAGYWPRATNNWPRQPAPAPQPTPPPFNPGGGTIIRQPIGTPAERIKTYPVAPRLPANPAPRSPTSPSPNLPQADSFRAASL